MCAGSGIYLYSGADSEIARFGTVGLSTGITPTLSVASKMVIIIIMFIGRLGAVTLLSMWIDHPVPRAHYTEETVSIG